jgi:hypothetical protein
LGTVLERLPDDLHLWNLGGGLVLEYMKTVQDLPPILQKVSIDSNDECLVNTLKETWKPLVYSVEARLQSASQEGLWTCTLLTQQTLSTMKNTISKYLKDMNRLLGESISATSLIAGEWTQEESLRNATEASLELFLEELMDA